MAEGEAAPGFLEKLRERKLVQWSLAYLAVVWVVLPVCAVVGSQFGWPAGLLRGITVLLSLGFFVTLILAWYHGDRGAEHVSGTELLILAVLLAVGGGFSGAMRAPSRSRSLR